LLEIVDLAAGYDNSGTGRCKPPGDRLPDTSPSARYDCDFSF